LNKIIVE